MIRSEDREKRALKPIHPGSSQISACDMACTITRKQAFTADLTRSDNLDNHSKFHRRAGALFRIEL